MSYQYYTPFTSSEHYLSASEIVKNYGIYTQGDIPHGQLVSQILKSHIKNYERYQPVYYLTNKRAMMQVYPSGVYSAAMAHFIDDFDQQESAEFGGRMYRFQIRKEAA